MRTRNTRAFQTYLAAKRCFDFVCALIASVVLLIPLALLAAAVFIRDPGNPFYVQTRVGKDGKPFRLVKLRSMRKNADDLPSMLTPDQLEAYRQEYKLDDDPRLIGYKEPGDEARCFGSILRRCSMDELPQIVWNVLLKGDMSLVGPRPILQEELERYYSPEEQALLLSVKPGLTGYWQAYARNNAPYATGERQRMELYYVRNMSPWLDTKILFATVGAVLQKRGVNHAPNEKK